MNKTPEDEAQFCVLAAGQEMVEAALAQDQARLNAAKTYYEIAHLQLLALKSRMQQWCADRDVSAQSSSSPRSSQ